MFRNSHVRTRNTILAVSLAVAAVILFGILFAPQKTEAYSGGKDCVGTIGGNFNVVVYAVVRNSNGNTIGFLNHFQFDVESYKNTLASKAEESAYNTWKTNSIFYRNNGSAVSKGPGPQTRTVKRIAFTDKDSGTDMANGQGNICQTSSHGLQASYAFRDGDNTSQSCYPPQGGGTTTGCKSFDLNQPESDNNFSWVLSCLNSNATAYKFSNPKVLNSNSINWNSAATAADKAQAALGSWTLGSNYDGQINRVWDSATSVRVYTDKTYEVNHRSMNIVFEYTLPAPPPPPVLSPNTSITGGTATQIEAGQTATPNASISGGPGGTADWTWEFWYDNGDESGPKFQDFDSDDVRINPPASGTSGVGTLTGQNATGVGGVSGQYPRICSKLVLTKNASGADVSPSQRISCRNIVRKPYLSAENGDVNTTCAPGSTGTITGQWNNTTGNGSSTNLAVYAGAAVNGFASAFGRTSPGPVKGLTFADDGTTFGGKVTGQVGDCATLGDIPTSLAIKSGDTSIASRGDITGDTDRYRNGVYYVDGNLVIAGPIEYTGSTTNLKLDTLPYLKVVVKGDIYIQPNVSRIEGVYQASGTIYTCAPGGTKPTSPTNLPIDCKTTLTVYGALEANNIRFLRLNGATVTPNAPAERIIFSPFSWLKAIKPDTDPNQPDAKFDSYTVMPPVL